MTPLDVVTIAVLGWFGSRLFISFRRSLTSDARAHTALLVRGLRPRHFVPVPLLLALVVGAAVGLTSIPPLDFGWWTAIGGQGNPAFGVTERTAGTVLELVVPIVFVVLLVPALPLLVEREELAFRLGAETWSTPQRILRAVLFGLVHAVIGIPIGVALALSIGGAAFTLAYLRTYRATGLRSEAVRESSRLHLAYNATIVGLVVLVLLVEVALALLSSSPAMTRGIGPTATALALVATLLVGCARGDGVIDLRSPAFDDGGVIPERFGCEGDNVSPPLSWSDVDDEAKELALVMADFDGPNGIFHHWIVLGIDPAVRSLAAGRLPEGAVLAEATSEKAAYIGPCPPTGERHEYVFTLFPLRRPLDLAAGVGTKEALDAIDAARLPGEGELRAVMGR